MIFMDVEKIIRKKQREQKENRKKKREGEKERERERERGEKNMLSEISGTFVLTKAVNWRQKRVFCRCILLFVGSVTATCS
jgi:hypothetical protein